MTYSFVTNNMATSRITWSSAMIPLRYDQPKLLESIVDEFGWFEGRLLWRVTDEVELRPVDNDHLTVVMNRYLLSLACIVTVLKEYEEPSSFVPRGASYQFLESEENENRWSSGSLVVTKKQIITNYIDQEGDTGTYIVEY